jgi:hypothetical protein
MSDENGPDDKEPRVDETRKVDVQSLKRSTEYLGSIASRLSEISARRGTTEHK